MIAQHCTSVTHLIMLLSLFPFDTCILCYLYTVLLGPLDLTYHIWCLSVITNPISEGGVLLEAPAVDEYVWGLVHPKEVPEDGKPTHGI